MGVSAPGPPAIGSPIARTPAQLLINQRISQAAVRRVNALRAALDGRTAIEASPPPARIATPRVTVTVAQLRINQRISQAAIRRLNVIRAEIESLRTSEPVPPVAPTSTEAGPPPALGAAVTLTAGQLRINRRISQAAIRRVELGRLELESMLAGQARLRGGRR